MKQHSQGTRPSYPPALARSSGPLVQDVLDGDSREVPQSLRDESAVYLGSEDIDATRYTSQSFHDREMTHMWSRVWQMVCREEDILNAGDHIVYEIGSESIIVVRTESGAIRAFPNACLHRGTQLRRCGGTVERFRCPFHGFTWSLSGELIAKPTPWDFPHVTKENFRMPEIRLDTWGGFVFICLSSETPPLSTYMETLPSHFARWPLENRHKAVHVAKIIRCNWKAAMEAFIEGFHIPTTHPQSDSYTGDTKAQYDVWPGIKHVNRVITWFGVRDGKAGSLTEQEIVEAMIRDMPIIGTNGPLELKEGELARPSLAQRFREVLSQSTGVDLDTASDSEMLDAIQYLLFPNFMPWGGLGSPIAYRFRPYQNDPHRCIMEVMYLFVKAENAPQKKGAEIHWLNEDELFSSAKQLGALGVVLDQDVDNLERIQIGLQAMHKKGVTLGNYQEIRIRHLHNTLDEYLNMPPSLQKCANGTGDC